MPKNYLILFSVFLFAGLVACVEVSPVPEAAVEPADDTEDRIVTLLFTNDVESAYDPIPAYWLDGIDMIGGIAEMTTLIENLRASEPNVFLFDSGDIFKGYSICVLIK